MRRSWSFVHRCPLGQCWYCLRRCNQRGQDSAFSKSLHHWKSRSKPQHAAWDHSRDCRNMTDTSTGTDRFLYPGKQCNTQWPPPRAWFHRSRDWPHVARVVEQRAVFRIDTESHCHRQTEWSGLRFGQKNPKTPLSWLQQPQPQCLAAAGIIQPPCRFLLNS